MSQFTAADVVSLLQSNPELAAALALVIRVVLAWQRGLTWPEYRTIHALKRGTFPLLDRVVPGNLFVNDKGYRQGGEFLTTRQQSVRSVFKQLVSEGGSPHVVSSIKRRQLPDTVEYSSAHVRWGHSDGTQTEAYLFRNGDGTCDVYAHSEASVTDPVAHLTGPQPDGDPTGVVRRALGMEVE